MITAQIFFIEFFCDDSGWVSLIQKFDYANSLTPQFWSIFHHLNSSPKNFRISYIVLHTCGNVALNSQRFWGKIEQVSL